MEVDHEHGNQPIHQDGDKYVNEIHFHKDSNTTNVDGDGNACHHSNPEVKRAGKVADMAKHGHKSGHHKY